MNEKGFRILIFLIVFFIVLFGICYVSFIRDDNNGFSFCRRMGYDTEDFLGGGSYSIYFGKITCLSSFEGEVITKTFNVKRKFGRFYLDE